jgi:hypothetical protein
MCKKISQVLDAGAACVAVSVFAILRPVTTYHLVKTLMTLGDTLARGAV